MKFKKIILWSIVNKREHKELSDFERTIESVIPLVKTLFPGIRYLGPNHFRSIFNEFVIPTLEKQFPELIDSSEDTIKSQEMIEVNEILACAGYEWDDNPKWQKKLKKILRK